MANIPMQFWTQGDLVQQPNFIHDHISPQNEEVMHLGKLDLE